MKFKIGDKVKYIRKTSPFIRHSSIGTIVNIEIDTCSYEVLFSHCTWWCVEKNLIKIKVLLKNQQLLFNFME